MEWRIGNLFALTGHTRGMTSFAGEQPRSPDGKFAPGVTGASQIDLDAPSDLTPSSDAVLSSSGADLDAFVHSQDTVVKVAAAANPNLTDDHVRHLSDPVHQPPMVRLAVARSPVAVACASTADDPSPTVRAYSSHHWASDGTRSPDRAAQRISHSLGLDAALV